MQEQPTTGLAEATATMLQSFTQSMTLQNTLSAIPTFNGRNIPLKDFIQDLRNVAVWIPQNRGQLITVVIGKLRGEARAPMDRVFKL